MNLITIYHPRYYTRTVHVADWRISHENRIEITATRKDGTRRYPEDFIVSGEKLRSYPLAPLSATQRKMRVIPLDDMLSWTKSYQDRQLVGDIKQIIEDWKENKEIKEAFTQRRLV